MPYHLLIAGAGHIGCAIAHLLCRTNKFEITLVDNDVKNIPELLQKEKHITIKQIDILNATELAKLAEQQKITAIVSCLPFFCNKKLVTFCHAHKLNYFDLTEDIETTQFIREIANNSKSVFVPQCGLAPGFINIIANGLMQEFDELDSVKLRCGGLPVSASNALLYAFTWSIDGLINEYKQPCEVIKEGVLTTVSALGNLENIQIDGLQYEAFNTSGGVGNLPHEYEGKVNSLNYKSIRYPGHRDRMKFLMQGLKLSQDVDTLKKIIQNAIPYTTEDVVIIYVSVTGKKADKLLKKSFVRKYYPATIDKITYSALQIITAASASAVINLVMKHPEKFKGYVNQEQFHLNELMESDFNTHLQGKK